MAIDTTKVAVALSGAISKAPLGATAPTDSTTVLAAAFVDSGAISADGVTLAMPAHSGARVQAETGMGRIQSDFPMPLSADARARKMDFNIGAGGPPIHITTSNGGIRLKRSDSQ